MHSSLNRKQADAHDVLTARADEVVVKVADEALVKVYEQIVRAEEKPSQPNHYAAPHPSDPQIPVETVCPAVTRERSTLRRSIGLLLAAFTCVAVIASQLSYSDAAKLIIAWWVPQLIPSSSELLEKPGGRTQPSPPTVQAVPAQPAPPQPVTPPQTTPQDVGPTAASVSPELGQSLQTMTRSLANVEQGIEQLKARQDQIASENAQAVEQLKASQEQMARLIAKASEQNLRPKIAVSRPQPTGALASKPARTPPSPQGTTRPQATSQPRAERQ
jgi:hypothetical protein